MWGLFFLFLVPGSSGLRCYFCTTPKGDICDGTTAVSQMDCFGGLDNLLKAFLPQTDNVCLNFEAEDRNGKKQIVRSCAVQGGPMNIDICSYTKMGTEALLGGAMKNIKCEVCKTDLCNKDKREEQMKYVFDQTWTRGSSDADTASENPIVERFG